MIEKTSKRWKGQMLVGCLMVPLGMLLAVILAMIIQKESKVPGVFGGLVALFGLIVFIHARVMAWWHHG